MDISNCFQSKKKPRLFWVSAIAPLGTVVLGGLFAYFAHAENHGIQIVSIIPYFFKGNILINNIYVLIMVKISMLIRSFIIYVWLKCLCICMSGGSFESGNKSYINSHFKLQFWIPTCNPPSWDHCWHIGPSSKIYPPTTVITYNSAFVSLGVYLQKIEYIYEWMNAGGSCNWEELCNNEELSDWWKQRDDSLWAHEHSWVLHVVLLDNRYVDKLSFHPSPRIESYIID